jgi:hypothetical protein
VELYSKLGFLWAYIDGMAIALDGEAVIRKITWFAKLPIHLPESSQRSSQRKILKSFFCGSHCEAPTSVSHHTLDHN